MAYMVYFVRKADFDVLNLEDDIVSVSDISTDIC